MKQKLSKDIKTTSKEVNMQNTMKTVRIVTKKKKNTTKNMKMRKRMKKVKKKNLQKYEKKVKMHNYNRIMIVNKKLKKRNSR